MNDASTSTTTIKVIVRHGTKCKRENPGLGPEWQKCNCRKSLYIYENGKDRIISARTRSWESANARAKEELDKRDPDKQEIQELREQLKKKEKEAAAPQAAAATPASVSIVDGTERWFNSQKAIKPGTVTSHRGVVNRIRAWAEDNQILSVGQITADKLYTWRGKWSPLAEEAYNKIAPGTQVVFQGYLKSVLRYFVSLGYLERDPTGVLKPIPGAKTQTQPLTALQFEELLAAIPSFCAAQTGILHDLEAEFEALFLLQRWAGLRILDALMLPRAGRSAIASASSRKRPGRISTEDAFLIWSPQSWQRSRRIDGAFTGSTSSGARASRRPNRSPPDGPRIS